MKNVGNDCLFQVLEIIVAEGLVQIQFVLQRGLLLEKLSPADVSLEDLHFFNQEAKKICF